MLPLNNFAPKTALRLLPQKTKRTIILQGLIAEQQCLINNPQQLQYSAPDMSQSQNVLVSQHKKKRKPAMLIGHKCFDCYQNNAGKERKTL